MPPKDGGKTMFGFTNREELRRWIAEAGMICIGAGVLLTSGCAGAARDGLAAGGSTPASAGEKVASTDNTGHASLSDRRPAPTKRRPDRQTASRTRPARPAKSSGDPFLADGPTVAQRRPRPQQTRPVQTPTAEAETVAAHEPSPGSNRPQVPSPKTTVAANSRPSAAPVTSAKQPAAQRALAESTTASRTPQRTIAQASARMPADARRSKLSSTPPIITPATPVNAESGAAATTSFERQRADRLMERAYLKLSQNFREEALRLATVAEQLEKSRLAVYRPGEERPSELVARLQAPSADGNTDSITALEAPASDSTPLPTRPIRSQPANPFTVGVKRGHVELTDIRAGWHAVTDSEASGSSEIARTSGTNGTDSAGQTQIAHLETSGTSNARLMATSANAEPAATAPAPPDARPATGSAVAASTTEIAGGDISEVEPVSTTDPATARSSVNAATVGGILAGLTGLLGLAYWRRQERKHYAGATR